MANPRTCKFLEVKKQGFLLSHKAACHLIASGCSVRGINKVLTMEFGLSSGWTKRNKKYMSNFSEELFFEAK
jgi:hypothetical protein